MSGSLSGVEGGVVQGLLQEVRQIRRKGVVHGTYPMLMFCRYFKSIL